MKNVARVLILVLLVALLAPMTVSNAQDGEGDPLVAVEISAVYFQSAASGSLVDNGNDTYTLTLNEVGPSILWLASMPAPKIQELNLEPFAASWAASPDLSAEAALSAAGVDVELTLSAPSYDAEANSITYVATVVSYAAVDGSKADLPESFDAANLSIAWSFDFQGGLVAGTMVRYEGVRATPEQCAAAQQSWNDYSAWRAAKTAEYKAASDTCRGRDGTTDPALKAAACDLKSQLADELNVAAAGIEPTLTLLVNECP